MKRIITLVVTLFVVSAGIAQEGVHFEHGLSWKEVVAKATKEKKYILVDCYTTWCGPCKYMSAQIFPQKAAGDFFNAGFISTKLQIDKTDKDDESIKAQYADAAMFEKDYKINVYPTFLFFSPKGVLVHRSVGAGTVEDIITEGKNATNPDKAFYNLLKEYKAGKISAAHLLTLASEAMDTRDEHASELAKAYIKTQKDLFTKENAAFLANSVQSTKDTGFAIIAANELKYDKVTEAGAARKIIINILASSSLKKIKPNIESKKEPEWASFEKELSVKYPAFSAQITLIAKATYFERTNNGEELAKFGGKYYEAYPKSCSADLLNEWAWKIFLHCSNKDLLQRGLELSKASMEGNEKPENMDTYACLLYKTGNTAGAIEWEIKASELAKTDKEQYQATIVKMKAGEKIWETME